MASSKGPRSFATVRQDFGAGRYPRPLIIAAVSWVLVGVCLLFSGVGAPTSTNQDRATENAIDALNQTQVRAPTGQQSWWFSSLWVLGVIVVIGAILLFLRHGWTRIVLAVLGILATLALAIAASWLVFPVLLFTLVGSVCSLLVRVHRYLQGAGGESGATTAEARVR